MSADFEKMALEKFEKLDKFEQDAYGRFEKLDKFQQDVYEKFDRIDEKFDKIDQRFEKIDERFERIDEKFGKIDDKLDSIDKFRQEANEKFDKIFHTMEVIRESQILVEHQIMFKIPVLFDGYSMHQQKQEILEENINSVNRKVDDHDIRISILEQQSV